MFDLPVDTKKARKRYAQFRRCLLEDGFAKMQFSVYVRHCPSEENATVHVQRVERNVPESGFCFHEGRNRFPGSKSRRVNPAAN